MQLVTLTWDTTINSRYDPSQRPHPAVRMTPGERGCAMSHMALWHGLASGPDDAKPLLILEDDVELEAGFAEACENMVRHVEEAPPAERTVLGYLGAYVLSWRAMKPVPLGTTSHKLKEAAYLWQTSSYLVWPAAARMLLSKLPVDMPIDCFIARAVLQARHHPTTRHAPTVNPSPSLRLRL